MLNAAAYKLVHMSLACATATLTINIWRAISVAVLLGLTTVGAVAQIVPTTGPEAMSSPAMQAWRQHTRARIVQMANRLAGAGLRGRTMICLAVSRNGRLLEAAVLKSSGNPEVDGAALAVVRKAGPFAPLPSIYPKPVLAVGVPIAFRGQRLHSLGSLAARFHGI